jgi:hypothetical protein
LRPQARHQASKEASRRIGLALVAIGLVAIFSGLNTTFFSLGNFVTIDVNSTPILIAVLGTSASLIAGYVDLSIGSMMALIGVNGRWGEHDKDRADPLKALYIGPSGQDVAQRPSIGRGSRNVSRLLADGLRSGRLLDEDFCANLDAVVKVDHVSVIETKTS